MNVGHLINGKEVDSTSGLTFPSINPATGEVIADVAEGTAEDIDAAVRTAHEAFAEGPWRKLASWDRARLLRKVAVIINERAEEIARLDSLDCGKPFVDNLKGDVPAGARFFEYYAGVSDNIRTSVIAGEIGYHQYTIREPYGVVGCIAPWNYPFAQACLKAAPALAAGNTVVIKMAEQTPLSTLELGRICLDAGIPEGVVNVVHGFGEVAGAALVRHPLVKKISFTGSTSVGKKILRDSADGIKSVTLELGGKTPNIVFEDCDLDQAVPAALFTSFTNSGQLCTSASRLLLQESIADDFITRLLERTRSLRIGDPLDEKTNLGPLVSKEQCERVQSYIQSGQDEGAKVLIGGDRPELPLFLQSGYFLNPTIFCNVRPNMRIAREEIFGPVLSIMTFKDESDAINIANNSKYGLAAAVWTNDLRRSYRMVEALEAGIVWINTVNYLIAGAPYCGHKESGLGEDLGLEAINTYTKLKTVYMNYGGHTISW